MDAAGAPIGGLSCRGLGARAGGAALLREVDLEVAPGTMTALVGPSGAGKTSLLRAVAGLIALERGQVRLGGRDLTSLPAHRRRCAVVFQEPRLLGHLDLADNVALALRSERVRRAERRRRAARLLDAVGLAGCAARSTRGLSGGEQQRVALARALCAEPELLMLDEPLAALDPNRREGLRRLIRDLQRERGQTALLITHDRTEAAQLGDHIALMMEGRIIQHDEPRALFERPETPLVARFFGCPNVIRGRVTAGRMRLDCGAVDLQAPDGEVTATIRPERVVIDQDGPLRMLVAASEYQGGHLRVTLTAGALTLVAHVDPADAPAPGTEVGVALPPRALWCMPSVADAVDEQPSYPGAGAT